MVAALFFLFTACLTRQSFPEAYAEAYCTYDACFEQTSQGARYASVEACVEEQKSAEGVETYVREMLEEREAQGVPWDASAAQECLEAFAADTETCSVSAQPTNIDACEWIDHF